MDVPSDWAEVSFRYSILAPLVDPALSRAERRAYRKSIIERAHEHPTRGLIRVSARSLRRWVHEWKQRRLTGLRPKQRTDQGPRILSGQMLDSAAELLRENPRRNSSFLIDELELQYPAFKGKIKTSTLNRHLRRLGVNRLVTDDGSSGRGPYKRFEAAEANALWHSDVHHGPSAVFDGNRILPTRIIAWIDDFSRLCCHCEAYADECMPSLEDCWKKAIRKCGIPLRVYADNGAIYSGLQFNLICADLQIIRIPSPSYAPWMHGKIERWWGVSEDQFWSEMHLLDALPIAKLNQLLRAWVETEYHRRVHSQTQETPLARWERHRDKVRWATEGQLQRIFWLWTRRKVSSTATVQLFKNVYYVDPLFARRDVICRYDPYDLARIEIWDPRRPLRKLCEGTATPLLTRRRETAPPPPDIRKRSAAAERRAARLEAKLQQHQRDTLGLMQYPIKED